MRYQILAIGSLKRGFYREGCDYYLERLKRYAKTELSELREAKDKEVAIVKRQESRALLKAADGYLIVLDERGKSLRSKTLAATIAELEGGGVSKLSLLLGGAEGHDEGLRRQAELLWSLSPLTLPHELARLVLLEQLYRAESIRAGHPYHRE